jgi:DNA-binding CsgD family transcriptional regulator
MSRDTTMVEVLRRYSNMPLPQKVTRLAQAAESAQPIERPCPTGRIHRVSQRLDQAAIEQLLQDYRDGLPSLELGRKYQLGKSTVLGLLRQHQVAVRRTPPLTVAQLDQAASWYAAGDSLKQIGERLQRDAETIRTALKRSGVVLRTAGRPLQRLRASA